MALLKTPPPLDERIKSICAEAEAFVDAEALAQQKLIPGMPLATTNKIDRKTLGRVARERWSASAPQDA